SRGGHQRTLLDGRRFPDQLGKPVRRMPFVRKTKSTRRGQLMQNSASTHRSISVNFLARIPNSFESPPFKVHPLQLRLEAMRSAPASAAPTRYSAAAAFKSSKYRSEPLGRRSKSNCCRP